MTPKIVVITGPTATGKTALSVALAEKIGGEVVGADSMQIYKYMDIGTAKPTAEETHGVPHHMIDIVMPQESYSVSRYAEEASACVDDILSRGMIPIVTGGTGLYIEALIAGRHFAPEAISSGLRREISDEYDSLGGEKMLELLSSFDPESGAKLHPNDKKRIVRAFEVYYTSGKTISQHNAETKTVPPRYDAYKLALNFTARDDLYARIDGRVDNMMQAGLEGEERSLLDMGVSVDCTSMQAIGYKEIAAAVLSGGDIVEAAETVKRESRRYAKRQISWFSRDKTIKWINWEKLPDLADGLRISTDFLAAAGVI